MSNAQQLVTLFNAQNYAGMVTLATKLCRTSPNNGFYHKALGTALNMLNKDSEAAVAFSKAAKLLPTDTELFSNWGCSLRKLGRKNEAEQVFFQALAVDPNSAQNLSNLGFLYKEQERYEDAERVLLKALEIRPNFAEAMNNLGMVLSCQGRNKEAMPILQRALEIKENYPEAWNNLGIAYDKEYAKAEEAFRKALQLRPNFPAVVTGLATCLKERGRTEEALELLQKSIEEAPDYDTSYVSLSGLYADKGDLAGAVAALDKAIELDPENEAALSSRMFNMTYSPEFTTEQRLAAANAYGKYLEDKVGDNVYTSWNKSSSTLRIGFVSGDYRNHPVGYFLKGVLPHLRRPGVELYAYSSNREEDALTSEVKPHFTKWEMVQGKSDKDTAALIHNDALDILFDLSGHTAFSRLGVFAYRPAPMQITWLGYWATTGVTQIDFYLADKTGIPPETVNEQPFTEKITYLPHRMCFSAPKNAPDVSALPAHSKGYVTFGCFQNACKISDKTLAMWGEIFKALPTARLRLQAKQYRSEENKRVMLTRLANVGISAERVAVFGPTAHLEYLNSHADVDIILDTFPYNGGTTTCESLWMGVPTVSLAGKTLIERQGAGLLNSAGLDSWVVTTPEDYVTKAIYWARHTKELGALREKLRDKVSVSDLFNGKKFADSLVGWIRKILDKTEAKMENTEAMSDDNQNKIVNAFIPVFWGAKDPQLFADIMKAMSTQVTGFHFADNMFCWQRNNSMLLDEKFVDCWKSNCVSDSDQAIVWRRYIMTMAGFHCSHLEGDFVECGCYEGVGSKTVLDYLGGPEFKKMFWLYDLFEHTDESVNHAMPHHGPQLYDSVKKRFEAYSNVKLFKGFLPEVLNEGTPEKIAWLHIDLNQAPAEIGCLEMLFDRVVPGGIIIFDDYEYLAYRAQKIAEDDWLGKRGYKVFPLPTSQGLVIKR